MRYILKAFILFFIFPSNGFSQQLPYKNFILNPTEVNFSFWHENNQPLVLFSTGFLNFSEYQYRKYTAQVVVPHKSMVFGLRYSQNSMLLKQQISGLYGSYKVNMVNNSSIAFSLYSNFDHKEEAQLLCHPLSI